MDCFPPIEEISLEEDQCDGRAQGCVPVHPWDAVVAADSRRLDRRDASVVAFPAECYSSCPWWNPRSTTMDPCRSVSATLARRWYIHAAVEQDEGIPDGSFVPSHCWLEDLRLFFDFDWHDDEHRRSVCQNHAETKTRPELTTEPLVWTYLIDFWIIDHCWQVTLSTGWPLLFSSLKFSFQLLFGFFLELRVIERDVVLENLIRCFRHDIEQSLVQQGKNERTFLTSDRWNHPVKVFFRARWILSVAL